MRLHCRNKDDGGDDDIGDGDEDDYLECPAKNAVGASVNGINTTCSSRVGLAMVGYFAVKPLAFFWEPRKIMNYCHGLFYLFQECKVFVGLYLGPAIPSMFGL